MNLGHLRARYDRILRDTGKFDANETAQYTRELLAIDEELYSVEYLDVTTGLKLVPVKTIDPGMDFYTYQIEDYVGAGGRIVNYSTDFKDVDVQGTENAPIPMSDFGASYKYSVHDLERSKFLRIKLDAGRARSARNVIGRLLDGNIWTGDAATGVKGFANNASVTLLSSSSTPALNGSWSASATTPATSAQILDDMLRLEQTPYNASNGVEMPTTMVMAQSVYARIASQPASTLNPLLTTLEVYKANAQFAKEVIPSWRLNTANAAGTGPRVIVYNKNERKLAALISLVFDQSEIIPTGYVWEVKCRCRCGGVEVRYPTSMVYGDV